MSTGRNCAGEMIASPSIRKFSIFCSISFATAARVVSKDDLIQHVWNGRIVSDSTLTSRITTARQAIGDSGEEQRLIRTVSRKGIRFVGEVRECSPEASKRQAIACGLPSSWSTRKMESNIG